MTGSRFLLCTPSEVVCLEMLHNSSSPSFSYLSLPVHLPPNRTTSVSTKLVCQAPALEVRARPSSLEWLNSQQGFGIKESSFLKCLDLCGSLPCGLRYIFGGDPLVSIIRKMIKNNKRRIIKDST